MDSLIIIKQIHFTITLHVGYFLTTKAGVAEGGFNGRPEVDIQSQTHTMSCQQVLAASAMHIS